MKGINGGRRPQILAGVRKPSAQFFVIVFLQQLCSGGLAVTALTAAGGNMKFKSKN